MLYHYIVVLVFMISNLFIYKISLERKSVHEKSTYLLKFGMKGDKNVVVNS